MSNPIKKIFKTVKKVFKKVVKVVKKVLPIIAVAAAVYFGGYALANGTLTGSGTHLSSMLTGGGMGQGGSLFVPGSGLGAESAAAKILSGGGQVGGGWLGGSGFPGMGTKEGITAINNTATQTALNSEVASNVAMTESVDAAGNFTDLGQASPTSTTGVVGTAAPTTGVAPGAATGATPADFAASNASSPLAGQASVAPTPVNTMGATAPSEGLLASSAPTPPPSLMPEALNPINPLTSAAPPPTTGSGLLAAPTAAAPTAANAPTTWYGKAWNSLGDYGKMAAVQSGGQMLAGYAKGSAEEEALEREAQKEQEARDRMNAQMYGTYQYVPGVGVKYVPWSPTTA